MQSSNIRQGKPGGILVINIDAALIKNGISDKLIISLIDEHKKMTDDFSKLYKYYKGEHAILNRKRASKTTPNNKTVANYAKYIVTLATGYFLGIPVTYSANKKCNIIPITDEYYAQTIASKDAEIAKDCSIYGRAYEMVYADENSKPRSTVEKPNSIFVVRDNSVEKKSLFAVRYYPKMDKTGKQQGENIEVYDSKKITYYERENLQAGPLKQLTAEEHVFGSVPVIEYFNNAECQGDFEQVISLIDAYNILQSDRLNDKEAFVEAILFLSGIMLDDDQLKKLREEKVLMDRNGNAKAEFLTRILNETDVEVLRKSVARDIHKFSMIPDLTDETFSGNLSGIAMKFMLLAFTQLTKDKERYFEPALKERFKLYNNFLKVKKSLPIVETSQIDVIFKRTLPINDKEVAEMIAQLMDIVSQETLLGQLSFVTDPAEELKIVKKENKNKKKLIDGNAYGDE